MHMSESLGRATSLGVAACATLLGCQVGEPPPLSVSASELFQTRAWPALAMNQVALPAEDALLRFVPAGSGTGTLSITDLTLHAGPRGLRAVHPVFSSRPAAGQPIVDIADRYRDVELELAPNAAERLEATPTGCTCSAAAS
jgi:hypothetical protein